jgi:hypothetical protein
MRKFLNNPWIVATLAVTAVAAMWYSLMPASTVQQLATAALASTEAPTVSELPTSEAPPLSAWDALKQIASTIALRDPFAIRSTTEPTRVAEKQPDPDFVDTAHLSGIWTQNGATLILINDQIHNIGESIGRFKIESASQEGVWLEHWKGRTFLALGKSFVLKTPANRQGAISSQ